MLQNQEERRKGETCAQMSRIKGTNIDTSEKNKKQ